MSVSYNRIQSRHYGEITVLKAKKGLVETLQLESFLAIEFFCYINFRLKKNHQNISAIK